MKKTQENLNGDEAIISYELASELGTIEKLYPKYGFIKCLNKENQDKRLFFHYSSIKSPFGDLQIGDNVFFQRGISKGKPLATDIIVQSHVEIIEGVIIKMPRKNEKGSISYKFNEECFYLPFSKDDLYEDVKLKAKDEVTFEKCEQDGLSSATNIRKKYNKPIKVQGIVTSVKDKFGFIDRSDMVKEIYFNLSASPEEVIMQPGIELEFNVKHLRNGKEEAVNLRVLDKGTVQFVDVFDNSIYGTLLRSPDCKRVNNSDPLAGNISYVCGNECKVMQIPFGEKDKKHQYSLHPGDIVAFKIAVDRRDQLQRACQVELCLDSFPSRKETRHMGVVKMFDGTAGLIEPDLSVARGGEEEMLVSFKAKEWLPIAGSGPGGGGPQLGKFIVVSYTPLQVSRAVGGHQKVSTTALRIMPSKDSDKMTHLKLYPAGSLRGTVKTAAHSPDDLGIIICQLPSSSTKLPIAYISDDVINCRPRVGDEVTFGCLHRINCQYLPATAFNIALCSPLPQPPHTPAANNSSFSRHGPDSHRNSESRKLRSRTLPDDKITPQVLEHLMQQQQPPLQPLPPSQPIAGKSLRGWIVILKEYFGFVETADHSALYKFGPGTIKKSKLQTELKVGSAIEFTAVPSAGARPRRIVDVFWRVLPDPLTNEAIVDTKRVGLIVRPLLISENTDKDNQYIGLLEDVDSDCHYSYSMKSLISFRIKLSPGDKVLFDVSQFGQDTSRRMATNVVLLRQSGRVSSVKKGAVIVDRLFDDDDNGNNGLPASFEIQTDGLDAVARDAKSLSIDDIVQIDLDLHKQSRNIVVSAVKLLKPADTSAARKVFKAAAVDDLMPRILHLRGPRIPEGESVGFTELLRRLPTLQC